MGQLGDAECGVISSGGAQHADESPVGHQGHPLFLQRGGEIGLDPVGWIQGCGDEQAHQLPVGTRWIVLRQLRDELVQQSLGFGKVTLGDAGLHEKLFQGEERKTLVLRLCEALFGECCFTEWDELLGQCDEIVEIAVKAGKK